VVLQRQGFQVSPKKVRRLMREDNLVAIRRRKFVVTSDSLKGGAILVLDQRLSRELQLSLRVLKEGGKHGTEPGGVRLLQT
jgi:transposase InsO family protein